MRFLYWAGTLLVACSVLGCSGGSSGSGGGFALIEFLESSQNNIPRNRQVRFLFSQPVAPGQDLFTRLRIQNVNAVPGESNFARAQGFYLLNGELVVFTPRLPNKADRSDAGFKENGSYHVYLSGGPDGLSSTSGDTLPTQQEFIFETNKFFEDVIPAQPPRALQFVAIDPTGTVADVDLSRVDPRPFQQAQLTTQQLLDAGNVIDPGAGGAASGYSTPWNFELRISETIDPSTVTDAAVQLYEVREDVFSSPPATPGAGNPNGKPVFFRVSAKVQTVQAIDETTGEYDIRVRVTPIQTLVDNTRYRLVFSGKILGIDFRKTFSGDNGLTGDGTTDIPGEGVYEEPGGLGYTTEFLVYDRPAISAARYLLYDPFLDGIQPENGQTANTEADINGALYNPASQPGTAVGFLSAFGKGVDGPMAVSGSVSVLDTGDTPNEPLGEPFKVLDLNPNDDYLANTLPGAMVEYDSVQPFELQLDSLTISAGATLRVVGVNPIVFRTIGLVQINGLLDVSGGDGQAASVSNAAGGAAGPGGFAGATCRSGAVDVCGVSSSTCSNFSVYLNGCATAKVVFPTAKNGEGPGRGLAGGEIRAYPYDLTNTAGSSGGGGGSHARQGTPGEDRMNAAVAEGAAGTCDTQYPYNSFSLSSVVGVRGQPGPTYGDREIETNTMGGSGGGAGGAHYQYNYSGAQSSGGGGGGGGGHVTIISAGPILLQAGKIDASGGNGGKGRFYDAYNICCGSSGWGRNTGGGGGGAGGSIALISGADMVLSGGILDATGGAGGPRGTDGTSTSATAANAGGDGGAGYILLMDADGKMEGFIPDKPGNYDNDARGFLTVSPFDSTRFSGITAITELFPMSAAKPAYVQYDPAHDIVGYVANADQFIRVRVSAAESNPANPTIADPSTEIPDFEIALLQFGGAGTGVVVTGDMSGLNAIPGTADRRAFVRVRAAFDYQVGVEAALGPFAHIDEVKISYEFNGD